jgi:putative colanic acid biosynthesis glycosyltransferase
MKKTISIVTITYNDPEGLKRTGDSIGMQKNCNLDDLEWIIVNGNPDNKETTKIIEDFNEKGLVSPQSLSEPDGGIYNAMNKGLERATAPWQWFLNGGDVMNHPNALQKMQSAVQIPGADFIYTDYIYGDDPRYASPFTKERRRMFTSHQAMLFRTDVIGDQRYDEKYRMASDLKFVTNYVQKAQHPHHVRDFTVKFDDHGVSQTKFFKLSKEAFRIRKEAGFDLVTNLKLCAVSLTAGFIHSVDPKLFAFAKQKFDLIRRPSEAPMKPQKPETNMSLASQPG